MRPVFCALLALVTSTSSALATAKVTIILQFDARHSEPSINEMKKELQTLMPGIELSWRQMDELAASDSFPSLVVVRFHGSCETSAVTPTLPPEPSALAYAQISNGNILPFADVECDRIRSLLASGPTRYSSSNERLLGRAIGRVLAHELHHILGRTRAHTAHDITRQSLSPRDLISDRT
ncbi:MAG TPA: hypothetical protein VLX58_07800 [Bryobacteraceae bacterium]|nr:hypothetical protein [Bryobacteraceae bacterium]